MVDIEKIKKEFIENDKPVPYKLNCNKIILLNQIKVKDWYKFNNLEILDYDKNSIRDIEIIRMTYLEFLLNVYCLQSEQTGDMFIELLSIVFKTDIDNIKFFENNNGYFISLEKEHITISDKDFSEIKKIILYQNISDYNEENYGEDIVRIIKDYFEAITNKNVKNPTLEDMKIFVFSKKNISFEEINNMSYRLFKLLYDMLVDEDNFIADKIIQASEKFKTEGDILHPLQTKKKTILERVLGDRDALLSKFNKIQ